MESFSYTTEPDKALGVDEDVLAQVLYIIYSYAHDKWDNVKGKLSLLSPIDGDALYLVFLKSFNQLFSEGTSKLIRELYELYNSSENHFSKENVLPVLKYNTFLNFSDEHAKKYFARLKESEERIDVAGLYVLRMYAMHLLRCKNFGTLISELDWLPDRYPKNISYQDAVLRSMFEYCLMVAYHNMGNLKASVETAQLILSHVSDDIEHANGQNKDTLKQVKNVAENVLSMNRSHEPYRSPKGYGRNDHIKVRYHQTGAIVVKKYKYLEDDLKNGVCIIVED